MGADGWPVAVASALFASWYIIAPGLRAVTAVRVYVRCCRRFVYTVPSSAVVNIDNPQVRTAAKQLLRQVVL